MVLTEAEVARLKADSREEGYKRFEKQLAEAKAYVCPTCGNDGFIQIPTGHADAHGEHEEWTAEPCPECDAMAKLKKSLAESQAREQELRRVLEHLGDYATTGAAMTAEAALAAPTDNTALQQALDAERSRATSEALAVIEGGRAYEPIATALREFGLRVGNLVAFHGKAPQHAVDAVLRGDR